MDRIIARKTGVVELIFDVPPDIDSAAALTRTRSIEVVKPNRQFWLDQRREDPRFMVVRNQFIQRQMRLDSSKSLSEIEIEFDQMHADSDGDGFSNLYERAFGMDSLGFDSRSGGPKQIRGSQGGPKLSFIRFTNPFDSTGENFTYLIESSQDMINWTTANVDLVNQVEVAEGVERVTYTAKSSNNDSNTLFLRVRIVGQ